MRDGDTLVNALEYAASWLNTTAETGPDLRVNAHRKVAHEAAELAENPCLEEAADVLVCLVGTALAQHWTLEDLAAAVRAKVLVNWSRTWEQQPDGTWQHGVAVE